MTDKQRLAYKNEPPGSNQAPCVGCGQRVVTARDAHVFFGGKRDGSVLFSWGVEPLVAHATDLDRVYTEPDLFLLGVAHRRCARIARARLEGQKVSLPAELPTLAVDEPDDDELPALHLPPRPDRCPFCGSMAATREHVFARWVSRELVATVGSLRLTTQYGQRRVRAIPTTATVCPKCNNRWLSVLENDVRPVLAPLIHDGDEHLLGPNDQRILATWAAKTALMLDAATEDPIIPAGFYHDLRHRRSALPSHAIWLGAYIGSDKAIWAGRRALHIGTGQNEPANGFVVTFNVFRVVLQVVGHFTVSQATINDDRLLSLGLHSIWPPREEPITWPRDRLAMNDDTLEELAQSIQG